MIDLAIVVRAVKAEYEGEATVTWSRNDPTDPRAHIYIDFTEGEQHMLGLQLDEPRLSAKQLAANIIEAVDAERR